MDRLNPGAALQLGRAWPLGATADDEGVNFAVFSAHAVQVDLCLFDADTQAELARLPLPGRSGDVWHGRLHGARPGLLYGLRVHGPWRPERGHRFNPHKLLLDPWAREIVPPPGGFDPRGPHAGADREHPQALDTRDNGRVAFKARVVRDAPFDWQGDRPPATPLLDSVLYEVHVRGFSKQMGSLPEAERGTYAGLASDAAIAHFRRLGITAVSLLPVQQSLDEPRLTEMGLVNHWGYNTLGFFCPNPRYAATATPRDEFKTMVRRLHAAGIEVLLDVVFNHTPEGDERGMTLSWRGLDNLSWYRLAHDKAHYENWSGCGNTLDIRHPRVLQMVMDSLRHWVQEFHVDGFRFDLAPVLGRGSPGFERDGPFFKAVLQDPALQGVKMIAEPWDLAPAGYQVGQFPRGWLEWNDRFRDTARAFWLGGDCTRGELALRLAGSSDLFQARRRSPLEGVNYIVSHDGFTLADLVSYDMRHNQANGENNRDGHGHNLSWNCGWEGPTTDPLVLGRRERLKRALLATVLLAQGTPMLAAGDELGHSQRGNNNPYCQDNEITWIDWSRADASLIDFTAHLLDLRRRLLPLDGRWYTGLPDARGRHDLAWLRRTGTPMTPEHWNNRMSRIVGAWIGVPGRGGAPLLLLINGRDMDAGFQLPPGRWVAELDTTQADGRSHWQRAEGPAGEEPFLLQARSVVLMRDAAG
ncbi:MAG: glycogen debranching protein GlgX [Rubrivivax sp.]|nr:glycogen debranching protein GlgX [Rubrivivax sp.]